MTARTKPERVAVVGSRTYPDLDQVRRYVSDLPPRTVVVSGGAAGVDRAAANAAQLSSKGLSVAEYLPDYDRLGIAAPLERNRLIVANCDRLVAFWDGKSRGTMHAVNLAKAAGKPVETWTAGREFPTRTVDIKHCTCGGPFGCDLHEAS